jgi:hypothetical protein
MALAFAYRYQSGGLDVENTSSNVFHTWAISKLKWPAIGPSDTSPAKVFKDPDAEYGKAYCGSGYIVQIEKTGHFHTALVMISPDVIRLAAIGDTDGLVKGTTASFCGLVLGTYSYSNTGGGTTHAIDVVGMFRLPANTH